MVRSSSRARISPTRTLLPSSFMISATTPSVCVGTSTWCSTERTLRISPGSVVFAADGGADGCAAGAGGGALGLEATDVLSQPARAQAIAPARIQIPWFFIFLTSSPYGIQAQA